MWRKALFTLRNHPSLGLFRDRAQNAARVRDVAGSLAEALHLDRQHIQARLHGVEHHPTHLASCFFVSPFEEAAVCAIDGFGDFVGTSWAVGRGAQLDVLDRVYFPHSLGLMYTAVTQYLGFLNYGDEYTVMGLAPYGEPHYADALRQLVYLKPDGGFELDLSYFRHHSGGVNMTWDDGAPSMEAVYTHTRTVVGPCTSS